MLAKVRSQITPAVAKTLAGGTADRREELRQVADRRDRDRDVPDPVAEPVDVVGLKAHVGPEKVAGVGVRPALLRVQLPSLAKTRPSAAAPAVATSQPKTAIPPTEARLTGSRKTPVPIMLPATSIVA